jgi:hypothetical protein
MAILKNTTISSGTSGSLRLPTGNIATRPGSPGNSTMRINTEKGNNLETFIGSAWDNNSSWVVTTGNRTNPGYTPRVLIQAESEGLNNTGAGRRQFIQINGTTIVDALTPRSYRLTKLFKNATTGQWQLGATNGYDVYGFVSEANAALAFLQTFREGEMLILTTYDEPRDNRVVFADFLRDNFASNIRGYEYQWNSRDVHLLVSFRGAVAPLFEDHRPSPEAGITASIWLP